MLQTSLSPFLRTRNGTPPQLNCAKTDAETVSNHVSNLSRTLKNDTLEIHKPHFSGEETYVKLKQTYQGKTLYGKYDDGHSTGKVGYFIYPNKDKKVFIQVPEHLVKR
jgi:hypothetical protein